MYFLYFFILTVPEKPRPVTKIELNIPGFKAFCKKTQKLQSDPVQVGGMQCMLIAETAGCPEPVPAETEKGKVSVCLPFLKVV